MCMDVAVHYLIEMEKSLGKFQYRHYALGLLMVVTAFSGLDRISLHLMVEPLKQDLQLSDTQIGLLNGFAFALFYAVAGIPIARWADRGNRNYVVTLTTAVWSTMVALSAFVGNFTQLLLARVFVAVGEAGCIPLAQSLIADYFNRAERPRATAIYMMCGPVAGVIAYLCGGWLIEHFGWRVTFLLLGLPGIAIAVLVKLTLREPRLTGDAVIASYHPPFAKVLGYLWQQKTFRRLGSAFCVAMFFGAGIGIWLPAFFMRSHDMAVSEVGLWFAIITGGVAAAGTYFGGYLCSRFAAGKESRQMTATAWALSLSALLSVACYLSTDQHLAIFFFAGFTLIYSMILGPVFSTLQSLVPAHMRSASLALIYLFGNLIGAGLGPLLAGVLSDMLTPSQGEHALRYTLMLLSPGYLWCAYFVWRAAGTVEADIHAVEQAAIHQQAVAGREQTSLDAKKKMESFSGKENPVL